MRVKSVFKKYLGGDVSRYEIQFEHNGVVWEKFVQLPMDVLKIQSLLNSVIEDTIARCR